VEVGIQILLCIKEVDEMYEITKDLYEISVWDDVLVEAEE
jgi:hypothetical protein